MVITGDPTQIDLPQGEQSGLAHALNILSNIGGIAFTWLDERDIVRHSLVQQIVEAYEESEAKSRNATEKKGPERAPDAPEDESG